MTLDEVREALRSYQTTKARVAFLQEQAEELRRGIELENRPELHVITAQQYTGMPIGTARDSITERIGIYAADGYQSPDAARWEKELRSIEAEIRQTESNARCVDIWLSALTEKERSVITAREIEQQTWEEMSNHEILGNYYSISGMRNIHKAAMQKIQNIAR